MLGSQSLLDPHAPSLPRVPPGPRRSPPVLPSRQALGEERAPGGGEAAEGGALGGRAGHRGQQEEDPRRPCLRAGTPTPAEEGAAAGCRKKAIGAGSQGSAGIRRWLGGRHSLATAAGVRASPAAGGAGRRRPRERGPHRRREDRACDGGRMGRPRRRREAPWREVRACDGELREEGREVSAMLTGGDVRERDDAWELHASVCVCRVE